MANAFPGLVTKPKATRKGRGRVLNTATFIARSRQESSEQKAIWNNDTRQFFDLTTADQTACRDALERLLETRLRRL